MTDKEVMQLALETLDNIVKVDWREWDEFASVEDFVRWAKSRASFTAEALRAALAQPEPAECDGGQCGIGGYCKQCPKTQPEPDYEAEFIKDWNEGKVRRVSDGKRMVPEREWVGLTAEELEEIAEFHFHGGLSGREFYDDIEAKLKEKNSG